MFEIFDGVMIINVTKSANRVAAPTANDLGALTMYNNPRF